MTSTPPPDRPTPEFDVRVSSLRGRNYLIRGRNALELNDTSFFIWKLCDGQRTVDDIAELVAAEYDAPLDVIVEDTAAHVELLRSHGFLEQH